MEDERDARHEAPVPDEPSWNIVVFGTPIDRWRAVTSRSSCATVRERLAQFLPSGAQGLQLTATRQGFLARIPRRRRPFFVEIALAEWEGGTRVQVTAPQEAGADALELDDLRRRIAAAIE
ncbi:MAG: hypothetical protein ABW221_13615 [Vicinamibacteria bacterium]